jgi:hypothetical protein
MVLVHDLYQTSSSYGLKSDQSLCEIPEIIKIINLSLFMTSRHDKAIFFLFWYILDKALGKLNAKLSPCHPPK